MSTFRIFRPGNGSIHPLLSSISHQLSIHQLVDLLNPPVLWGQEGNLLRRIYSRTLRPILGLLAIKNNFVLVPQTDFDLSFIIRDFWFLKGTDTRKTDAFRRILRDVYLSLAVWATFSDGLNAVDEGAVGFSLEGEPACDILESTISTNLQEYQKACLGFLNSVE